MLALRILAFAFLIAGFGMVLVAKNLVKRYGLDRNVKCDFENEMNEEELAQYKFEKAMVNVKMMGLLVALPGLVLVVIAFR